MDTDPHPVLGEIARFLADARMEPSVFGKVTVGDPNLIRQLRQGREPRRHTLARIRNFIATGEA